MVSQTQDAKNDRTRYAGDPKTLELLEKTLKSAGVDFIEENGGGPGVRLRKRPKLKR